MIAQRSDHLIRNPWALIFMTKPVSQTKPRRQHLIALSQGNRPLVLFILSSLPSFEDK